MKRIFLSVVVVLVFVLSGCGSVNQKNEAVEPDANEVFREMYSAVTVAASANGNEAKFRWKNNTMPFPYQEASWADVTVFPCDGGTKGRVSLMATTYDQGLGSKDFSAQVEKVRTAWESRGLRVRDVGSSKNNREIATDLPHGTTVVYSAGAGGESVEASTECFAGFKGDESSAEVFPAEKA
ncbi:hypothetical protein [Rothia nasimurium]|uniref:hypothetical protein n=1 Tax=Rothia nasimurium TaxID=85336 RepID=UPI001F1D9289|nr:hypothetical protein [Rothia nasimurium]